MIKAVIGSAGLRIAGMGFTFLVGVQLARGLGAEGYGIYGLAMSVVSILGVPTQFGLPQLLTREVAAGHARGDWSSIHGILRWANRTVLWTSLLIGAAVFAWLLISGQSIDSELATAMLMGLALVPLIALCSINAGALRGLQHIVKGQLPDVVLRPALFSLLLFVVPFVWHLNATVAMALGAASAGFALIFVWIMLRRELQATSAKTGTSIDAHGWWSSAMPMALTEGMRVLQGQAAILFLGMMSTIAIVGVYRVASSVALVVAMPLSLFNIVSAPIISRLHTQGDRVRLQRMLAWMALGMFGATLLLAIPFMFAGELILGAVFGDEFSASAPILLALCAGIIINGFFGANSTLLNMTGHQMRVTRASTMSLLLLAVLLPFMIWQLGGVGAALAVSAALTAWNLQMWRDAARLTGIDTSVVVFFKVQKSA